MDKFFASLTLGVACWGSAVALADSTPGDTTCHSAFNTGLDNSDYPDSCDDNPQCPTVTVGGRLGNSGRAIVPCDALFCDDMDRYCTTTDPDHPRTACPDEPPVPCYYRDGEPADSQHASSDNQAMMRVWQPTSYNENTDGYCGTTFTVQTPAYKNGQWKLVEGASMPYGARYPNGGSDFDLLGQETVDLVPLIQAKYGEGNTIINGTDAQPLILNFTVSSGIQSAAGMQYNTGYMELGLQTTPDPNYLEDEALSPMDYVMVGDDDDNGCLNCFTMCENLNYPQSGVHIAWPTICQAYEPRTSGPAACPPAKEQIWNVLAIGNNAMLDNNPCHCENPADQVPNNAHLSFFDGYKWLVLRNGHCNGGICTEGDFAYGEKVDTVRLTIYSNTVDIYHRARIGGNWVESRAFGVPRMYTGPFNKLRAGASHGCELREDSYRCKQVGGVAKGEIRKCIKMGDSRCDGRGAQFNKAGHLIFDNVYVRAGTPAAQTGSCCHANGTCTDDVLLGDCQAPGDIYGGPASQCADALCCPHGAYAWADIDADADVDHADYGRLQACLTGTGGGILPGCACLNRDGDNDIDQEELEDFLSCVSGPDIPWTQSAYPDCVP